MTGEQYYRAHRATAIDLGINDDLVPWENLTIFEKAEWEQNAFEQDLRDRESCAMLRRLEREGKI